MFILTRVADTIRLIPQQLKQEGQHEAITNEINYKYANKVIQKVGLCVVLFDILTIEDGKIRYGDGSLYIHTVFRLIVFRPFVGEVLIGKISSSTDKGLRVSLEFFADIFVPARNLFSGCKFEAGSQRWYLPADSEKIWFELGETIRFCVEKEIFTDSSPTVAPSNDEEKSAENSVPTYEIEGSTKEPGCGPPEWWPSGWE